MVRFWRGGLTRIFASVQSRTKYAQRRTEKNQIGEAYGGLGSCRSDHFDMFAFRCQTHAKQHHILSCGVRFSLSYKLFVGFVFDVLLFSVVVPICLGSCPFCSVCLTQRFCAQFGKMLRRLPHSVLKNCGPRVVKQCN